MEKEYVKILKKQNKTKVQAVNRKNPPIIYYKPNKINVQSLDSRVFINVQKYCMEKNFFLIKTNTGLNIFYITMFRVKTTTTTKLCAYVFTEYCHIYN